MTPNDFRIGNLLNHVETGEPFAIEAIALNHNGFEGYSISGRNQSLQSILDEDIIEPIPLTEEWLLKFGFEKREHFGQQNFFKEKFMIEEALSRVFDNGLSFRIIIDSQNSVHTANIKYVHQLQNLYFALTGNELI